MRVHQSAVLAAAIGGLFAAMSDAWAADMTADEIKAHSIGKTQYVELGAATVTGQSGQGVIYRAEDGTAIYKTPTGAIWTGTWEFKGNTLCSTWKQATTPGQTCSRYDKTGDVVTVLDAVTGAVRVKVLKTAPGNAEKLAP
jgi:hypothetical protein